MLPSLPLSLGTQWEPGPGARMALREALLTCLGLSLFLLPGARAQNHAPPGCSPDLNPLYYNLCDRSGAWGIVLEAVAGAGVVTTFVLTIILVASLPFVQDTKKRSLLGTQVFFLLGTLGLFCLVFACVVKPDFSTCASRRFLFGVLFAVCFSCLVAHAFALNFLARKNHGPRGWVLFFVALLLTLVEVIINTEWLIITLVRRGGEDSPPGNGSASKAAASPCAIANADFVMALIYVMLLLLSAFTGAWPILCGRFKRWRKHGVFVLLATTVSIAIWVVWIVMYTFGNRQHNSPTWDDPTLAIALAANAWAFVLFYVIPEVSQVTKASPEQSYQGDLYPTRGVGYETILKEQKGQSMFVENKAFSMDEPASGWWRRPPPTPLLLVRSRTFWRFIYYSVLPYKPLHSISFQRYFFLFPRNSRMHFRRDMSNVSEKTKFLPVPRFYPICSCSPLELAAADGRFTSVCLSVLICKTGR